MSSTEEKMQIALNIKKKKNLTSGVTMKMLTVNKYISSSHEVGKARI